MFFLSLLHKSSLFQQPARDKARDFERDLLRHAHKKKLAYPVRLGVPHNGPSLLWCYNGLKVDIYEYR
jgi:hypothetical protein